MARTGDFVTPRLWGSAWFEKPPLLYWMVASGTLAGLNPELAARLPVALLSLAFLAVCFGMLRREFGFEAAAISTALLATSAGWITYSDLCLTDLPLAVCFSIAVFSALPLLDHRSEGKRIHWRFLVIGIFIGLAVLAKGLVPIALCAPFFWFLRRSWRSWWIAAVSCGIVAAPWYLAMYSRNGYPFIQEFFWKHHIERLYSPSLQHVHPWYYYFPVLLAGLFPWTPLLGLLFLRGAVWDVRRRFLAAVLIFGFVFFTLSLNKLPGYLLPLIPSLFAIIGAEFETKHVAELSRWWLIACAALIAVIPMIAPVLPESLTVGRLTSVPMNSIPRIELLYVAALFMAVFLVRRSWAGMLLALCVVSGGIYLKNVEFPILDRQVSARGLWRSIGGLSDEACDLWIDRDWLYGLGFYRGALFPPCAVGKGKFAFALRSHGHGAPALEPIK